MLGKTGTPNDPYTPTVDEALLQTAIHSLGNEEQYTRPVTNFEDFLVSGLKLPKRPVKKFFDTDYEVGQAIKPVFNTPPSDNSSAFLDLLKKAAHKLASLDTKKAGQALGRYADATGSQGGFRQAQKHLNGGRIPFLQNGDPITWGIHKPQMDEQGREVTEMESAPDNFGRNTRISRIVTPRRDGTFKNDTVYGVRFMSNGTLDATSYDMKGKQYGLSPRNSIGKPFDKWGEYFKHVMSLKKQQTPQTTPAQKPSSSNYYLSMAM